MKLDFRPLTGENWADFEELFGRRGACGGCWCMWWRLPPAEYQKNRGEANRQSMKSLVSSANPPGILAYGDGHAIGWCSVAPRRDFIRLEHSRSLKPVDDADVWSVVCLFVHRTYRRRGVSVALLRAVARYVRSRGGRIVEGYPVEPKKVTMPDVFAWTGLRKAFEEAGFADVTPPGRSRRIVRLVLRR